MSMADDLAAEPTEYLRRVGAHLEELGRNGGSTASKDFELPDGSMVVAASVGGDPTTYTAVAYEDRTDLDQLPEV